MNKIKVAQVITRLDRGGAPDIVSIIFTQLDPSRYELKLISGYTCQPSFKTCQLMKNLDAHILYIPQLRRQINPIWDIVALIKLYFLFQKEKFDIVHTHTAKAGALGRIAARLAGVPKVIHTPHGHNFYGYFGPGMSKIVILIERFIASFTDKIIVLTELEKRDLINFKIIPTKKIAVINSGLEIDAYHKIDVNISKKKEELQIDSEVTLVGMIGRLEPVKGPEYLIAAAKLVAENFPKVKFLIVGDGTLRGKLEADCKKLMISDKCIFTGWREDIPQILSILDILVLPSVNEAVGRILIEAGACGLPVIASNVGGVPGIVKDQETGILVPPKDPPSLAKAIINLLEDKEKRIKMGVAAKNWVDDKFKASKMVESISNLYTEVMKNEKT